MSARHYAHQTLWPNTARVPLLGFAANSGGGKTTLLRQLIPLLIQGGVRVGLIKHAHHGFEIDYPGKDSYELRKAGAAQVVVTSRQRYALMADRQQPAEPQLAEELARLDQTVLDLVLVEGFKHEQFPKIELWRPSLGHTPLFHTDSSVIAVASDVPDSLDTPLPVLDLNDTREIARFVHQEVLRSDEASKPVV